MVDAIPKKGDNAKGQEKSARNLLCRASFFSGCNHYSQRAYCTKESACYQKLSRLHVPTQACFLVPPGKSQKRRNGRNRKCFITAEGKSLEYREYRLDVSSENQHLYRSIIIFQEDSLQYLSHDQQMAQDLDDGSLIAVSQNLLSTAAAQAQPRLEPASYSNVSADQLVSSITRVCSSSPTLFEPPTWLDYNKTAPSSAELVSMISQSCQLHIPTPRYPLGHLYSGLRAGL